MFQKTKTQPVNLAAKLGYTLVIGNNMKKSIVPIEHDNQIIIMGTDAFIFEKGLFLNGVKSANDIYVYRNYPPALPENKNLLIFLLADEYSDIEAEGIRKLKRYYDLTLTDEKLQFIKLNISKNQLNSYGSIPVDSASNIEKSGFLLKTDSENSIFNIITIQSGYVFLITIVLQGFISKSLSQPIERKFRAFVSNKPGLLFRLKENKSWFKFPWEKEEEPPPDYADSMKEMIECGSVNGKAFIEALSQSDSFKEAFDKLENKNMIINFRVICRTSDI